MGKPSPIVLTAPVIQAYSRRQVFYALQGNMPLARWATSRILHAGGLVVLLALVVSYVVLEHVLEALTPDTTLLYLCFALLLASALLDVTPLLAAGDGWGVFVSAVAGAGVLLWRRPPSWTALVDVEGGRVSLMSGFLSGSVAAHRCVSSLHLAR